MDNQETKNPEETIEKKKSENGSALLTTFKVVLAIFLVIIVSGLAVLHFLPDSSLALVIDSYIMQLTSPDTNKPNEPEDIEETHPVDKEISPIDEEIPATEKAPSEEPGEVMQNNQTYDGPDPISEEAVLGTWYSTNDEGEWLFDFLKNGRMVMTDPNGEREEWEWWIDENLVVYKDSEGRIWKLTYGYFKDTERLSYDDIIILQRK